MKYLSVLLLVLTASCTAHPYTACTSCATQRIMCRNDNTGQITYMGRFDAENKVNYIVDVADGVRDFYPKQSCKLHEPAARETVSLSSVTSRLGTGSTPVGRTN